MRGERKEKSDSARGPRLFRGSLRLLKGIEYSAPYVIERIIIPGRAVFFCRGVARVLFNLDYEILCGVSSRGVTADRSSRLRAPHTYVYAIPTLDATVLQLIFTHGYKFFHATPYGGL